MLFPNLVAYINKTIICITVRKTKHPFTSYPAAENLGFQTYDKNQSILSRYHMDVKSNSRNSFAYSGSFAKFSVSVESVTFLLV